MKYLLISDIHGSCYYFEKALEVFDKYNCDEILILGDILYHGPRNDLPFGHNVKKLINLLNERKDIIKAVKGNCDAEVDQMVLNFPINNCLKLKIGNITYYLTHGHHFNPSSPVKNEDVNVVLYGHTHVSNYQIVNNVVYFNPGSISIPKDSNHSLAVIEDNIITYISLDTGVTKEYKVV